MISMVFRRGWHFFENPSRMIIKLLVRYCPNLVPDKQYIQYVWEQKMDYPLDLDNPKTFCEKLQWLKLHDHNPLYHKLVDKFEVKAFVADKIGPEHVVKLYGVYNSIDEVDIGALPNSFVLKHTGDSGGFIVCKDKKTFNWENAKESMNAIPSSGNYYLTGREWAYKNVKPRIIAEEFIDSLGKPESIEYKITCMNGKVKMITVCSGIAHVEFEKRFNDHFDREGNRLPFYVNYKPAGLDLPPKEITDELIRLSEVLSEGIPQVRVDWYIHKGNIFFGEMTFYTWAGFMNYVPKEWDRIMGDWLELNVDD